MASPTFPVSVPLGQGVGTAGDHIQQFFPYKSEWVWRDHPGAVRVIPRISHIQGAGAKVPVLCVACGGPAAHADVRSPMLHTGQGREELIFTKCSACWVLITFLRTMLPSGH